MLSHNAACTVPQPKFHPLMLSDNTRSAKMQRCTRAYTPVTSMVHQSLAGTTRSECRYFGRLRLHNMSCTGRPTLPFVSVTSNERHTTGPEGTRSQYSNAVRLRSQQLFIQFYLPYRPNSIAYPTTLKRSSEIHASPRYHAAQF